MSTELDTLSLEMNVVKSLGDRSRRSVEWLDYLRQIDFDEAEPQIRNWIATLREDAKTAQFYLDILNDQEDQLGAEEVEEFGELYDYFYSQIPGIIDSFGCYVDDYDGY
jgi:hypothetical protein